LPQQVRDPFEKRVPGIGIGRDGARTPMQWDASDFAGFSTVEPWLPVADDFRRRNVDQEVRDPASIHHLYRRLIAVRRQFGALSGGSYRRMPTQGDLLLYERRAGDEQILIALNFGPEAIWTPLPHNFGSGRILVSCFGDREKELVNGQIALRGDEGLLIQGSTPLAKIDM
jgi:alpha-glucosidase